MNEKLEQLNKKLAELERPLEKLANECRAINEQQENIRNQCFELKKKYVLEHDVLKKAIWSIRRSNNEFCLCGKNKQFKELCDMLQHDYHCSLELEPGVELHFDDWDITISFENNDIGMKFLKNHDLKINLDSFKKERDEFKKMFESLDEFLSEFETRSKNVVL